MQIIDELSKNMSVASTSRSGTGSRVVTVHTPSKGGKRILQHSPTPRKSKKKSIDVVSPTAARRTEEGNKTAQKQAPVAKKRLAEKLISPEKARVQIRYATEKKLRTRIVSDQGMYNVLVSIVRGDNLQAVVNKLFKVPGIKEKMYVNTLKIIDKEMTTICKLNSSSIIRNVSASYLTSLNFSSIADEVQRIAPTFSLFIASLSNSYLNKNDVAFSVLSCMILRYRNIKMSQLHHVIGQLLDCGGATDEIINIISHLGLSVSLETVYRKRTEMLQRQKMLIKENVICQVQQRQTVDKLVKTKKMVENLTDSSTPVPCSSDVNVTYCTLQPISKIVEEKGMSTEVNYFDMCSSFTHKTDSSCKPDFLISESKSRLPSKVDTCNYFDPLDEDVKISSRVGEVILPAVTVHPPMQAHFPSTVQSTTRKTLECATSYINKHSELLDFNNLLPVYDIIGDNCDITKSPSHMTKEKQRKSFHWFLNVAVERRVTSALPDDGPISDIMAVPNSTFLPSSDDCKSLENNMIFHILKVLTKHIDVLKPFSDSVPKHIEHKYMEQTAEKSNFYILDLLDKSENKSDELIDILEHIHKLYIPHTDSEPPDVIEKKVFGGDVLTNERAYSAQLAMMNGESDFFRLAGVVHRPEGLHRIMNFLLFIYQEFYKQSSAADQGTLCQLRNVVRRVDVSGPDGVIDHFRPHYAFVMDCLDAYIIGAAMDVMGLDNVDEPPRNFRPPPLLTTASTDEQFEWVYKIAKEVLEKHIKLNEDKNETEMSDEIMEMDNKMALINEMYHADVSKYICTCGKQYKKIGFFKRHLVKEHNWLFSADKDADTTSKTSKYDNVAVYRTSFMRNALLLRDTYMYNAYNMGDGDRIVRNAKFEMLCADVRNHYKYKLWLWRFQAYVSAILSQKQSFEYKWNCSVNTNGGVDQNIPNDNLVEIMVQTVKKKIREQGANFTFESAKKVAMCTQVQEEIKKNVQEQSRKAPKGRKRTKADASSDIGIIVHELLQGNVFGYTPGRQYESFKTIKDVNARVNLPKPH